MLIALRYAEKEDWISDYDDDEAKDAVFIITMMQLMLTMQIMMIVYSMLLPPVQHPM